MPQRSESTKVWEGAAAIQRSPRPGGGLGVATWGRWTALLASGEDVGALARLRLLVHSRRHLAAAADLRQRRPRAPPLAAEAPADAEATVERAATWIRGGGGGGGGAIAARNGGGGGSGSSGSRSNSGSYSDSFCSGSGSLLGDGGRREGGGAAVTELGELYAQAARAEPLLRRAVMRLAAATRGAFPATSPADIGAEDAGLAGGGLTAAAALEREWGAAAWERVRWPGLKPSGRALEKLVRAP